MAQLRCTNVAFCCNGCTPFSVDGANGRLLEVTDDLSCSIFSANTIAGLPVIEAFANYCVSMGQFGGHKFEVTCTSIRGGKCTTASGTYSFVGGGRCNIISIDGCVSTIGGGNLNCVCTPESTIAGGCRNIIINGVAGGFIGGGLTNKICGTGDSSGGVIVGGILNTISGYGTVGAFIGGGITNTVSAYGGLGNAIVGGNSNTISGCYNRYSVISGGVNNTISGNYTTGKVIGGGEKNTASGNRSTISGGYCSIASAPYTFVGGGNSNTSSGYNSAIGGGYGNTASEQFTFVGGGIGNTASGYRSVVVGGGGGYINNAATNAYSFLGGGFCNKACGYVSFVGGGQGNTAGNYFVTNGNFQVAVGGYQNTASGNYSFIGGGYSNFIDASSPYNSIVGGLNNSIQGPTPTTGACNTHIVGGCITATSNNYTYVNNLCQTGGGLSDCRVKNTIEPVRFGLQEITQLNPVSFCWNGDSTCHKKYGFIAQNVQQAMSCVVTCNKLHKLGPDGTQVLNGEEGEPLLEFEKDAVYASYVNAFKELKKENDELRTRLDLIESILKSNNLM
jgi:hypothetical protein